MARLDVALRTLLPFKGNGGEKGALAKAEKWLANACHGYKRAGHKM